MVYGVDIESRPPVTPAHVGGDLEREHRPALEGMAFQLDQFDQPGVALGELSHLGVVVDQAPVIVVVGAGHGDEAWGCGQAPVEIVGDEVLDDHGVGQPGCVQGGSVPRPQQQLDHLVGVVVGLVEAGHQGPGLFLRPDPDPDQGERVRVRAHGWSEQPDGGGDQGYGGDPSHAAARSVAGLPARLGGACLTPAERPSGAVPAGEPSGGPRRWE